MYKRGDFVLVGGRRIRKSFGQGDRNVAKLASQKELSKVEEAAVKKDPTLAELCAAFEDFCQTNASASSSVATKTSFLLSRNSSSANPSPQTASTFPGSTADLSSSTWPTGGASG